MKIGALGQSNLFQNVAMNQALHRMKNNEQAASGVMQFANRDTVTLSPQGQKQSMVQQLMSQKDLIQECKNNLMEKGVEQGYLDEAKLKEYDEQLKAIDEQIAQAMTQEPETDKTTGQKADGTSDQDDITKVSMNLEQSQTVLSVQNRLDGQIRVLEDEIKSDGSRASDGKIERLADMKAQKSSGQKIISDLNQAQSQDQTQSVSTEEDEPSLIEQIQNESKDEESE